MLNCSRNITITSMTKTPKQRHHDNDDGFDLIELEKTVAFLNDITADGEKDSLLEHVRDGAREDLSRVIDDFPLEEDKDADD